MASVEWPIRGGRYDCNQMKFENISEDDYTSMYYLDCRKGTESVNVTPQVRRNARMPVDGTSVD